MSTRASSLIGVAVLAVIAVQFAATLRLRSDILNGAPDLAGFYSAGQIVTSGQGHRLYDLETQTKAQEQFTRSSGRVGPLIFNHAPFELFIYVPLSQLPFGAAFYCWFACNLLLLLLTLALLRPYVPMLAKHFHWVVLAAGTFYPITIAVMHGQDSVLLLFLFATCYVSLRNGCDLRAGWLLALAAFKPQFLIPVLITLIATKRKTALLGFLQGGAVLAIASAALVGWNEVLHYPRFLMEFDSLPPEVALAYPEHMATVRGLVHFVGGGVLSKTTLNVFVVGVALAMISAVVHLWRLNRPISQQFAVLTTAAAVLAYHAYLHDSSLLLLPALLATDHLATSGLTTAARKLTAIGVAVMYFVPFAISVENGAAQVVFCAAITTFIAIGLDDWAKGRSKGSHDSSTLAHRPQDFANSPF